MDDAVAATVDSRPVPTERDSASQRPLDRLPVGRAIGEPAAESGTTSGIFGRETAPVAGSPAVVEAARRLEQVTTLPLAEHAELYEQVHAVLQEQLTGTDGGAVDITSAGAPGASGESATAGAASASDAASASGAAAVPDESAAPGAASASGAPGTVPVPSAASEAQPVAGSS